ncbi:fused isobutyryl-CoA mutase/GTPase IcmF [Tepidibacillus marianensis]|uniref:fused isobutyryl-CoA mutase/GTPase IcmF n=1 Tax=Tepidibacillus marianensis TaxID=3131995 RepID=UPI0030D1D7AE
METEYYRPAHKIRFVTASSLFDGHDASIHIFRRLLQAAGTEVIHLGHNRSAEEVVNAAIDEDVQGIAMSSYQGGHIEYFKYVYDLLQGKGAGHIRIFGGGGGVIVPTEMEELERYGIAKIFSPEDGRLLGLVGMINHMLREADFATTLVSAIGLQDVQQQRHLAIARLITLAENSYNQENQKIYELRWKKEIGELANRMVPVIGITGTGGAGKSSLTDELVRRFLQDFSDKTIAILSIDPSRQKTGGALLGDRIRMNSIHHPHVFVRSLATRDSRSEISLALKDAIEIVRAANFDLIFVETSGIGQGDTEITALSDLSIYVMTSEYGAPSQLEKIDMLDFADLIVINKFDRKGSEDALRDVRKQYQRNHQLFDQVLEDLPVYGTIANRFNDQGMNQFYQAFIEKVIQRNQLDWKAEQRVRLNESKNQQIIPPQRESYLYEIVGNIRQYQQFTNRQVELARQLYQLNGTKGLLGKVKEQQQSFVAWINEELKRISGQIHQETKTWLEEWSNLKATYQKDSIFHTTLSGSKIPRIALPPYQDWGELVKWRMKENLPGFFPFTAGVFPYKRIEEEPKRQFAGEGSPERTNRRFHYLSEDDTAKRLSTAFDSVTLYGEDPDLRPDIYGKIGESGVSIATIEDMKKLYAGFDLCAPNTSVSMTINGPAPILLAMFMNTAIDQQIERFQEQHGREPDIGETEEIKANTLQIVRGTVQADILKEDQGQNTCIFSTEFALKMMGDIQEYFIQQKVHNYYSVSISGYHIAEAGANPITQLAFTLANAFTYVEYYLSRGMKIDDFAPNLSFFFSNGMDAEYSVLGRVARRIWSVVMKYKYGANERSQKLKYHIQTSGRSLHAMEMDFNDIRTTLQALMALFDHCNSLHTNAYDEAITIPTENSVRRAMAIQMIITRELGLAKNENPLQGSFIIEELTDLVEEAVLQEFERLNARGGVLGAMETAYQRSKIQEESMQYEMKKHSGELPIIGINTFLNPHGGGEPTTIELSRGTIQEKDQQIERLRQFQEKHQPEVDEAINRLKEVALRGGNIFTELMNTVKVASLGRITKVLYEVGGQYRRNM